MLKKSLYLIFSITLLIVFTLNGYAGTESSLEKELDDVMQSYPGADMKTIRQNDKYLKTLDSSSLPYLIPYMESEHRFTRYKAIDTILRLDPQNTEIIIQCLQSGDSNIINHAIRALNRVDVKMNEKEKQIIGNALLSKIEEDNMPSSEVFLIEKYDIPGGKSLLKKKISQLREDLQDHNKKLHRRGICLSIDYLQKALVKLGDDEELRIIIRTLEKEEDMPSKIREMRKLQSIGDPRSLYYAARYIDVNREFKNGDYWHGNPAFIVSDWIIKKEAKGIKIPHDNNWYKNKIKEGQKWWNEHKEYYKKIAIPLDCDSKNPTPVEKTE